jgi:hypothetical protein
MDRADILPTASWQIGPAFSRAFTVMVDNWLAARRDPAASADPALFAALERAAAAIAHSRKP